MIIEYAEGRAIDTYFIVSIGLRRDWNYRYPSDIDVMYTMPNQDEVPDTYIEILFNGGATETICLSEERTKYLYRVILDAMSEDVGLHEFWEDEIPQEEFQ